MKNAVIVGANGFGGLGLITILLRHPNIRIMQLIDKNDTGIPVSDVFPHLNGYCDIIVNDTEQIDFTNIDIAFFSTPDRAGMTMIKSFFEREIPVIDFSGDFRFKTINEYRIYAQNKGMDDVHLAEEFLEHSVYGLPEINAQSIQSARVVGNPGCFSVSMILGLLPVIEKGIVESNTIICDGKTGVSGAGKSPGSANFYPQRYENTNSYREARHQHIVEVENIFKERGKTEKKILFIPQIVPLNRGILMTIYADIESGFNTQRVFSLYQDYYRDKPFVIITDRSPNTTDVRGSNRCVIKPMVDERTGKLVIISAIDNLMKGQSGNAVQNANILLGLDETAGLDIPAFYP